MKANKFLRIALVAVLCMAMLFATACGNDTTTTGKSDATTAPAGDTTEAPTQGGTTNTDVPTEEGKVTYYFTMSADSPAVPEHAGVFITGGAWGWGTGADSEMFTKLEGTDIYYLITDKNPLTDGATADQEYDFQLVVGLTEASGAATWGLQWNDNFKSVECAEVAYPDNPKFTWNEGDNKVNLGTHTFTSMPPAPVEVETTLEVTFTTALPEGAKVLVIGAMNGWNGEAMTSEDGKTWTLDVKLLANTYEYKIKVFTAEDGLADDFTNKWDCGTEYGGTDGGNLKVEITEYDGVLGVLELQSDLVFPKVEAAPAE